MVANMKRIDVLHSSRKSLEGSTASARWNGRCCNAKQRHRQHRVAHDDGILRIRLVHNLPQQAASEDA